MLSGKTIVLGVTGGIAAYKAATLCSRLTQAGARVDVIMTSSARKFVQPLTFQALSRRPVYVDVFEENDPSVIAHIDMADRADLIVIAPATANFIGKMAHGLADDMLSTTVLASTAPIWIAPAMNGDMYAHPAVQANLALLNERGVRMIDPGEGQLACGYTGKGRLAEPEQIFQTIDRYFHDCCYEQQRPSDRTMGLAGKQLLVTAGGTRERIDPVRFIGNDSSGKMGHAFAEVAVRMGMEVTLITSSSLPAPTGVFAVPVESAAEMYEAVMERAAKMDIIVKAAAVSDYKPVKQSTTKIKKTDESLVLYLERTRDILATLGQRKERPFLVGFAAETNDAEKHAMDKLIRKNCDLLVLNDVTMAGAGFGEDTNIVQLFGPEGKIETLPILSKLEVAQHVLHVIAQRMPGDDEEA